MAGRSVRTYRPQVSVVLLKTIGRTSAGTVDGGDVGVSERFKGSARKIDLTPYLGEGGTVTVSKSVRDPCGMFSVSLADRMEPEQFESLYGLIEPMDVVEIRMARDTSVYAGELERSMPIMMRGFVSQVRRDQTMSLKGAQRTVTISGQDYGKILQMMRVDYRFGQVIGQNLLTALKLAVNYGIDAKPYDDAAAFITEVMQKVINTGEAASPGFLPLLRNTAAPGLESPVLDIGLDLTKGGGSVMPFGAQDWSGGSIYDLLRTFGDVGAWNELYIEDREAGPFLVYRPTPFRTLKGDYIQAVSPGPETVEMVDEELVSLTTVRSDEAVANAFYVNAPRYDLVTGALLKAAELQSDDPSSYVLMDYANSTPKLYGLRVMEESTQQGMRTDGQQEAAHDAGNTAGIGLTAERRRVLVANNKDNVVLETGAMKFRGDEEIRAGCYVRLQRGGLSGFSADHYAYQVTHEYVFGQSYITSVNFDRGTGFVERLKSDRGIHSPYLAEMTARGTYG